MTKYLDRPEVRQTFEQAGFLVGSEQADVLDRLIALRIRNPLNYPDTRATILRKAENAGLFAPDKRQTLNNLIGSVAAGVQGVSGTGATSPMSLAGGGDPKEHYRSGR